MTEKPVFIEIGLVLYPNALLSAVYGLTDLFNIANIMASKHVGLQPPVIRTSHWQSSAQNKPEIKPVFDTHPAAAAHHPTILISPPSISDPISSIEALPFAKWLALHHAKGATLCSVCAGSFLLAETGLLKNRPATTHWVFAEAMADKFPEVQVDQDKLIIDDGDIITTGGMMSWIDLGLRLVHRLLGPTIMLETSRFMLVDPPGREQRYYSNFIPKLNHGDDAILKVQHWLQTNGVRDVTLHDMAAKAGMEERTFLRHFQKATGLKPTEYTQHLRIGKGREMLEFTNQNVEQIAWTVGYEDTGAFRKVFHKITGLTPGEYRTRFSMTRLQQDQSRSANHVSP